jgi:hypothetical protein
MILLRIIVSSLVLILDGFIIGRVAHITGGQLNSPHHWIPGLIFIIIGLIYFHHFWGQSLFLFGTGLFISDFKDFLSGRFWDRDDVEKKVFWNID